MVEPRSNTQMLMMSNSRLARGEAQSLDKMLNDGLPARDPAPQVPRSISISVGPGPVHRKSDIDLDNLDMVDFTHAQRPRSSQMPTSNLITKQPCPKTKPATHGITRVRV